MAEVPEELKNFNIKIVYCGEQPDTHKFIAKKVLVEMADKGLVPDMTKEMIQKYA